MLKLDKLLISNEENERYIRHLNLPLVKIEGQLRIMSSKILFIGAGGLASSSLLYLTAAGVKTIGIIDDDSVDISNLQRQIIYSEKSLGIHKVKSAKESIKHLNKKCKVRLYYSKLNLHNALKIIKHYSFVVDCTDNIKTRKLIDKTCNILNIPYIYAAISQFTGQVSVFHFQNNLSYNDIISETNNTDDCKNNGVLSLLPGIIGLFQANEIMKIILGIPTSLNKYMLLYEALGLNFYKIRLAKKKRNLSLRRYAVKDDCIEYNPLNYKQKFIYANSLIIDIRDSYTSMIRPIENAIKIPIHYLINDTSIDFIKAKAINHYIYIYCESESKTNLAIKLLKKYKLEASKY